VPAPHSLVSAPAVVRDVNENIRLSMLKVLFHAPNVPHSPPASAPEPSLLDLAILTTVLASYCLPSPLTKHRPAALA